MEYNEELGWIQLTLQKESLSKAMDELEGWGLKYPELNVAEPLAEIRNDYKLMIEYWSKGYKDEQRGTVYKKLKSKMRQLLSNLTLEYNVAHNKYIAKAYNRVRTAESDWSMASLVNELETFVADVAMLELEQEHKRGVKQKALYANHQKRMNDLFDFVWTSRQWNDGITDIFKQILLSPTVDTVDQQMITSAVMLSNMNIYDTNKFRLLLDVYRNSTDEHVRQRALVGWVMSTERCFATPEEMALVKDMIEDEGVRNELTELQIQMLYCVSAESDNATIQKDIMPDLLKNNSLHITGNGIEEKEEDPMEDILDPDASERNMEKVEQSFRKMMDMQKQGSDIYFGGFSQMKRFPFFDSISNWFVPFYKEHPAISGMFDKESYSKIIQTIVGNGPFCNSDKYSFVIAFSQVLDRIPENVREVLKSGNAVGLDGVSKSEQQTPAYIRRTYLQDLYRFYKIYPSRKQFYNPFDGSTDDDWSSQYLFFRKTPFAKTQLTSRFNEVAVFMFKRKMYVETAELLKVYSDDSKDYQYYMLKGASLCSGKDWYVVSDLEKCYKKALELRPDDQRALRSYAKALFKDDKYVEAGEAYGKLLKANPDNKNFMLNYSVCLTNGEKYDEALKLLYKLNYEYPDNINVTRVLARAIMGKGDYEEAHKLYATLIDSDKRENKDLINLGYCEWFTGNIQGAAKHFAEYLKVHCPTMRGVELRDECARDIIGNDKTFIQNHGITDTETQLMIDFTCASIL